MTNRELDDAIYRLNKEQSYYKALSNRDRSIPKPKMTTGQKLIDNLGKASAKAASSIGDKMIDKGANVISTYAAKRVSEALGLNKDDFKTYAFGNNNNKNWNKNKNKNKNNWNKKK